MLFNLIYPMVSSWKQLSLLVYILMNLSLMWPTAVCCHHTEFDIRDILWLFIYGIV